MTTLSTENVQETTPSPSYAIDPNWYGTKGFSLYYLAGLRRCQDCEKTTLKAQATEQSKAKALDWRSQSKAIQTCCSKKAGYITSQTPMLESVFRLLLKTPRQTLTIENLFAGLQSSWITGLSPRDPSFSTLAWVLNRQSAYGIAKTVSAN